MPSRVQRAREARRHRGVRALADAAGRWSLPALALFIALLAAPLPALAPLPPQPADSILTDRFGRTVALLYQARNRIPIPGPDQPAALRNATVAIEDDTFWIEPGVDPVGIVRAAVVDLRARRVVQGGSTLTQQLVKNLYLTPARTLERKLAELFLALKLSASYDKRAILTMYLNDVYFGEGAWGAEAASRTYFGHGAAALTLPEAALLAGVINAPSYYDPYLHPRAAVARRNLVLARMAALGYLSPAAARRAQAAPLALTRRGEAVNRAPFYTQLVAADLAAHAPDLAAHLNDGGYRITTAMDWAMQRAAQAVLAHDLPAPVQLRPGPEPEGALVAIDPRTGDVDALVGGRDWTRSTFNRALYARRQPGSTMKYFLYTTVIDRGFPTSSVRDSAPERFPAGRGRWYVPHNFGHVYNGELTIRRAIALSDNIVAVKWMDTVGPPAMIATAHAMGIQSPLADNLTTALGSSSVTPLEMARAVAPLANGGFRIEPLAVLRVTDAEGHVLYRETPQRTRVLPAPVAYVVTSLFQAPLDNPAGTAHDLRNVFDRPAAAKTGTSSAQRDGWLVGYTPQLTCAVWVGNDNDRPIALTGDRAAGPAWADFMATSLAGHPVRRFVRPPGVVTRRVCVRTGLLANGCCTSYQEVFVAGHEPVRVSPGCGQGGGTSEATGGPPAPAPLPGGPALPGWLQRLLPSWL